MGLAIHILPVNLISRYGLQRHAHIEKLSLHLVDCLAKLFKWAEFGVGGQGEEMNFFFFASFHAEQWKGI